MTTLNPFFGIVIDDTFTQIKCNSEVIYHLWTNDAILTTKNITYSNDTIRDITVKFNKGQNETLDKLDVNQSGVFVFSENAIIHKIECQVNFKQINGNEITLTLMPNKSAVDTISLDTDKIPVKSTTTIEMTNSQASGIFSQLKISADEGNNIVLKPDGIYVPQPSSEGFNYEDAINKPTVNNVELIGNKTSSDLGLSSKEDVDSVKQDVETSKQDIQTINSNIETINTNIDTVNSNINDINGELQTINSTISNIDEVLIPNKANITLDNVNVGSGKEDKIPSFNADGSIKFIDQPTSTFELNYLGNQSIQLESGVKYKFDCDGLCLISFVSSNSSLRYNAKLTRIGGTIPSETQFSIGTGKQFAIQAGNNQFSYLSSICSNTYKSIKNITESDYGKSFSVLFDADLNCGTSTVPGNIEFEYQGFFISSSSPYWFNLDVPLSIRYYGNNYTPININANIYKELNSNNEIIGLFHESALPKERQGRNFQVSTLEERDEYRKNLQK